ncbi:MAG: hypothetical protein U0M02_04005 [Acutalibacteraceae bacterium]|nr:hypothetical protein [Acutalibacteraceae bacterium]
MDTTVITDVATTVAEMQYEFAVTPENLAQTVPIMGKGMIGIFIVMGIIILCVTLLNNLGSPERKQKREAKKAAKVAAKQANGTTNG